MTNLNQEEVAIKPKKPFARRDRKNEGPRLNHRIRVREIRVIGADGSQLGVMETRKAIELAQEAGLDLCEISPKANPPVCKILDYGKYKYELAKKARIAKKKQVKTQLKEIKFRPGTDDHDVGFKVKHILRFLAEGDKVKISVRFRGREMAHTDLGMVLIKQIVDLVGDLGIVEQSAKMEGRMMTMVFAPNPKAKVPQKTKAPSSPENAGSIQE